MLYFHYLTFLWYIKYLQGRQRKELQCSGARNEENQWLEDKPRPIQMRNKAYFKKKRGEQTTKGRDDFISWRLKNQDAWFSGMHAFVKHWLLGSMQE